MPQNSQNDRNVPRKRSGPSRPAGPGKPARHTKRAAQPKAALVEPRGTERIAKVMARAGACSRRDAEAWIGDGRVTVNGEVLRDPAFNVGESDTIMVDGSPLPHRAKTRLFRFHKPRGLVTTEHDPEGRTTIFEHLREHWPDAPRVVSVGRLDINTEGLMLLTNDGGLARVLELPATGWVRRYRVRVNGETDQAALDQLARGITIEGVSYAGIEATLDRVQGANCWLTMSLREGKNREVKRVLEHLGLAVNRLIRLSFGPFQLGELAEGAVEEVRTKVLRDQLGPSLAKAAGADFTSPAGDEPEAAPPFVEGARHRPARNFDQDRRSSEGRSKQTTKDAPRPRTAMRAARPHAPEPPAAPKVKPEARVRKHVSVLRRQEADVPVGPRKRIERTETADRSGRVVSVERVVAVAAKPAEDKVKSRNGRRFESLRKGPNDTPARKPRGGTSRASNPRPDAKDTRSRSFPPPKSARPGAGKSEARAFSGEPDKGSRRAKSTFRDDRTGPSAVRAEGGERSRPRFERSKAAETGRAPSRMEKRPPVKNRTDSSNRGASASQKPAGRAAPGGGRTRKPGGGPPQKHESPGSPRRKT